MKGIDYSQERILGITDKVFSGLDQMGIKYSGANRFLLFTKAFKKLVNSKGKGNIDKEEITRIAHGFKDVCELEYIFDNGVLELASEAEIKLLLSGNRSPDNDSNSNPRDLQFQMYFAAHLLLNQFKLKWEEPDLKLLFCGDIIQIAIKRLSSPKKLTERIREAEKQICNFDGPGIIVLSLDNIIVNDVSRIADADALLEETKRELRNALKLFEAHDFNRKENIKAILAVHTTTNLIVSKKAFGYGFFSYILPIAEPGSVEFKIYETLGRNFIT